MLAALLLSAVPLQDVEGRVALPDGAPLAGATVLTAREAADDGFHLDLLTTSSPDGALRVPTTGDVLPMFVVVAEAGCAVAWVEDGALRYEAAPAQEVELVVTDGGRPVADTPLRLHGFGSFLGCADVARPDRWSDEAARARLEALLTARTDADGVATFAHLPVELDGAWFLLLGGRAIVLPLEEGVDVVRVDLAEHPTTTARGRVTDARGRPLAGVEVTARWPGLEWVDGDLPRATTDEEGRYVLTGVALGRRGKARIRARLDGVPDALERPYPITGEDGLVQDLTLFRSGAIRGRFVGPDGAPVEGMVVEARRPHAPAGRVSTRSDADGRFAFEHLSAGPYQLIARDTVAGRILAPRGGFAFAVAGDEDLVVELAPDPARRGPGPPLPVGKVRVRFVEQGTDEPVEPGYVLLVRADDAAMEHARTWTPTAAGCGEFDRVPIGDYVLVAGGEALHPVHLAVRVERTQPERVVGMRYPRTARVAGRVAFPGAPRAGHVRASWSSAESSAIAQHYAWLEVGADGEFDLGKVYEGRVTVEFTAPGWRGEAQLDVGPLGVQDARVEARPVRELEFVAADALAPGRYVLEFAAPGEPWREALRRSVGSDEAELFVATPPPGATRWRLLRWEEHRWASWASLRDLLTGTLDAEPGARTRIEVPAERPDYPGWR